MTTAGHLFRTSLRKRELEITKLSCVRRTALKKLAGELGIAHGTMKNHMARIYEKAGVSSRLELMMFCFDNGVVPIPDEGGQQCGLISPAA